MNEQEQHDEIEKKQLKAFAIFFIPASLVACAVIALVAWFNTLGGG